LQLKDVHEAKKLQRIECDEKIRLRQEEFEEKSRQQKAGFEATMFEVQQKYSEDLKQEQQSASAKFASVTMQHQTQMTAAEAVFRKEIFEAHNKISEKETRVMQLEQEKANLSSTIETLRNDAARFQEARRAMPGNTASYPQQQFQQHIPHGVPHNAMMLAPKAGARAAAEDRPPASLRTTANEAAAQRRRVIPTDVGEESTDSDLGDNRQKASKRKKVECVLLFEIVRY
jgi:hypothetical protein